MSRQFELRKALISVSLLLLGTAAAGAESWLSPVWEYPEVVIEFKVNVMGIVAVTGQFHDVRIDLDEVDGAGNEAFTIIVCPRSLDTRNAERDRLLRSATFFDVDRFPAIAFSRVRLVSANTGEQRLLGDLTLRGVSRPVAFKIIEPHRANPKVAAAPGVYAARATINRSQFGLDAFPVLVGDEVEITVYINPATATQFAGL